MNIIFTIIILVLSFMMIMYITYLRYKKRVTYIPLPSEDKYGLII